ncbi:MAG: glycosyltransferase family 4 protein [Gemmataceae bacterium]|nr:glycosyltransferase family 4 protein [Gemmataceae bacterium]
MSASLAATESRSPKKKVLVVTGDVLPLPGLPTTGAGMRAWGLAQGLRSRGHHVTMAMTRESAQSCGYQPDGRCEVFDQDCFQKLVEKQAPDVLVCQHWYLATLLREKYPNTVIDLHGPLILENLFRVGVDATYLFAQKLLAMSRADFFCCAGERQRNYFYAWLQMAGFDLRELPIQIFPYSLAPELPEHEYPDELSFVYGGVFLPWQNPTLGLRVLLEELDRTHRGRLNFFGGKHPWLEMSGNEFDKVCALLKSSAHATLFPMIGRAELIERYRKSSVAWDVMTHNCERGMAITSRTVEYLWAGLPVVYNDYAELSEHIRSHEAGWCVDPENEDQIRAVVHEVFARPDEVRRRGQNAQRLVRERFTWDKAIEPLHRFVCNPSVAVRFSRRPLMADPRMLTLSGRIFERIKRRLRNYPRAYQAAKQVVQSGRSGMRLLSGYQVPRESGRKAG